MTSETDEQFVARIGNTPLKEIGVRDGARLFALVHRGAGLTLDRQRHVVREDHSHWIRETYSRYVPYTPPSGEPRDE